MNGARIASAECGLDEVLGMKYSERRCIITAHVVRRERCDKRDVVVAIFELMNAVVHSSYHRNGMPQLEVNGDEILPNAVELTAALIEDNEMSRRKRRNVVGDCFRRLGE